MARSKQSPLERARARVEVLTRRLLTTAKKLEKERRRVRRYEREERLPRLAAETAEKALRPRKGKPARRKVVLDS